MALERQDLHNELVALIAAGRELPPEHDSALADIFLNHPRYQATPQPAQSSLMAVLQDWRVVAGALLLALTAFLFGTGFGHAAGPYGGYGDRDGFSHAWYHGDDGSDMQGGQWQNDWPPFNRVPNVPAAPSAPSSPSNPGI
jgi:hypothetical protein